jgi:methyl-accepting chemotaxis protein
MEEQTSEVERGAQTAVGAGQALESIVAASNQSAQIVQAINQAAAQQAQSTGAMLFSVESISQLVGNTLAQVRQTAEISKTLAAVSQTLTGQLAQFEVAG